MTPRFIARGQNVSREKIQLARELRHNMTAAETILWRSVRANRLDGWHFRRQQIIDGFIVDFYCHAFGLVIEVDGEIHDCRRAADQERDAALRERGFRVLRFRNEQVLNQLPEALEQIRAVCKGSADKQPASPPLEGEGPGERSGAPK